MPTDKQLHKFTAILFTLIAAVHVIRLVLQVPATFGSWQVPMWLSVIAVLLAGYLAARFWH